MLTLGFCVDTSCEMDKFRIVHNDLDKPLNGMILCHTQDHLSTCSAK